MALTSADLGLSSSELATADLLEAKINEELKQNYVPGQKCEINISALTPHKTTPHARIRHELARRYKIAGWVVDNNPNYMTFKKDNSREPPLYLLVTLTAIVITFIGTLILLF